MRFRYILTVCVVLLSGCTSHTCLYDWEKGRKAVSPISEMAICYGGHSARNPYLWTPERFGKTVTYVDEQGVEHWLFGNMLMMEIWTDDYKVTYSIANDSRASSTQEHWQELIDYWFDGEHGLSALDRSIEAAAMRIGAPPSKRGIVFSLPDPVYFENYTDAMKGVNRKPYIGAASTAGRWTFPGPKTAWRPTYGWSTRCAGLSPRRNTVISSS